MSSLRAGRVRTRSLSMRDRFVHTLLGYAIPSLLILTSSGCVFAPSPGSNDNSDGTNCGGIAGVQCVSGQYCKFESGCGEGDQSGTCVDIPVVCTEEFAPVC